MNQNSFDFGEPDPLQIDLQPVFGIPDEPDAVECAYLAGLLSPGDAQMFEKCQAGEEGALEHLQLLRAELEEDLRPAALEALGQRLRADRQRLAQQCKAHLESEEEPVDDEDGNEQPGIEAMVPLQCLSGARCESGRFGRSGRPEHCLVLHSCSQGLMSCQWAAGGLSDAEANAGPETFPELLSRFRVLQAASESGAGGEACLRSFFFRLVSATPGPSGWLRACQSLAQGKLDQDPSDGEIESLLEATGRCLRTSRTEWGEGAKSMARLALECARHLGNGHPLTGQSRRGRELAHRFGVPRSLVGDLAKLLKSPGSERRTGVLDEVRLPVVLVSECGTCSPVPASSTLEDAASDSDGSAAFTATLHLELISDGQGVFYPAPEMLLVSLDAEFRKALEDARNFFFSRKTWDDRHDIRWSLASRGAASPALLRGGSLGASFALGAGHLLADLMGEGESCPLLQRLARLQLLNTICLSSSLHLSDTLEFERSGGVIAKCEAALATASIHILVLPRSALPVMTKHYGRERSLHNPDAFDLSRTLSSPLTVLCKKDLQDALVDIEVEESMPAEINWERKLARCKELVARTWLEDEVRKFEESESGGVMLIQAKSGAGKTGLIVRLLANRRRETGQVPVAHFLTKKGMRWDDPKVMYDSLCAQLRRKHRLGINELPKQLRHTEEPNVNAARRLGAVLVEIAGQGKQDTIWIDSLDTGYGERARFAPRGMALYELILAIEELTGMSCLPKGIRLVVTSQPSSRSLDHLQMLPKLCRSLTIVDLEDPSRADHVSQDLENYFHKNLPDWTNVDQTALAHAAMLGGSAFLHAENFVHHVRNGEEKPVGMTLDGLLDEELLRIARRWSEHSGVSQPEAEMEVLDVLGILACAREPVPVSWFARLFGERMAGLLEFICDSEDGIFLAYETRGDASASSVCFRHDDYMGEFLLDGSGISANRKPHLIRIRASLADRLGLNSGSDLVQSWHARISKAFSDWRTLGDSVEGNYAKRHLLSHLRRASLWEELIATVMDAEFLLEKLRTESAGIHDLVRVLNKALEGQPQLPPDHDDRPVLTEILEVLRSHAHAIARDPRLALQQLFNALGNERGNDPWFQKLRQSLVTLEKRGFPWLEVPFFPRFQGVRPAKLTRHRNWVHAVAFSPPLNGGRSRLLATAGADHWLRLWETRQGQCHLRGDFLATKYDTGSGGSRLTRFPPSGVAFLNHGRRLACASSNGVHIMEVDVKYPERSQLLKEEFINLQVRPQSLASAPETDLPFVAIGCRDGRARIWDVSRRLQVATLNPWMFGKKAVCQGPERDSRFGCVAMSRDGRRLASGRPYDHGVEVWEMDVDSYLSSSEPFAELHCRLLHDLPKPADRQPEALAFSPDGKLLAVGGGYELGYVEIWNLETNSCVRFPAHSNSIWGLAFTQDPAMDEPGAPPKFLLCTSSYDRLTRLWDLDLLYELVCQSSSNQRTLIGSRTGYTVTELNGQPEPRAQMAHAAFALAATVSPDQQCLAVSTAESSVSLWDVRKLVGPRRSIPRVLHQPATDLIHASSIDPKGQYYATCSDYGQVRLRFFHSDECFRELRVGREDAGKAVRTVSFSSDGGFLVYGTWKAAYLHHLEGMEADRGRRLAVDGWVHSTAFSKTSGEPILALGDHEGRIYLVHNLLDAQPALLPMWHEKTVRGLAFSPCGQWLASAGDDRRIYLWDLKSPGRPPVAIGGQDPHRGRIKSIVYSSDGLRLATGGWETIRIWRKCSDDSWILERTLLGHRDEIWSLAFSACGRFLASGSHDSTARVWNLHTGEPIFCLPCDNNVLAVWMNNPATELRLVETGPTGRFPLGYVAKFCGLYQ